MILSPCPMAKTKLLTTTWTVAARTGAVGTVCIAPGEANTARSEAAFLLAIAHMVVHSGGDPEEPHVNPASDGILTQPVGCGIGRSGLRVGNSRVCCLIRDCSLDGLPIAQQLAPG